MYHLFRERFTVGYYHGGLDAAQRRQLQQQFVKNQLQFLIATNAFGMGIDKSDIRYVVHYDLPDSLENYVQEIGRAGRDQEESAAILFIKVGMNVSIISLINFLENSDKVLSFIWNMPQSKLPLMSCKKMDGADPAV